MTETITLNYSKIEWTYDRQSEDGSIDDFGTETDWQEVALLLPAVQQVREAARRTETDPARTADDAAEMYVDPGITSNMDFWDWMG